MRPSVPVVSGDFEIKLPDWGRCFWQDPNDGQLFLAYASGKYEVDFVTSSDSGVTWSAPKIAFHVDDFSHHSNFDVAMDKDGELHCGFRFSGSGCYAHLTKASGSWHQQGTPVERGWCVAADSGQVGGFNGSMYVHETDDFLSFDGVSFNASFRDPPQIYTVAKCEKVGGGLDAIRAARILSPFTTYPDATYYTTDVSAIGTGVAPGLDGGFPIMTNAGKPVPTFGFGPDISYQKQVVYSASNTGIVVAYPNEFEDFVSVRSWRWRNYLPSFGFGDPGGGAVDSGLVQKVHLTPTMGFTMGPYPFDPIHPIIVAKNEQDLPSSFDAHWDMYSSAFEPALDNNRDDQFFSIDSTVDYSNVSDHERAPNFDEWAGNVFAGAQPPNVAPALAPYSGSFCDVTNGAASGTLYMYFNSRSPDGTHCVTRMLCKVTPQQQPVQIDGETPIPTRYEFSSRFQGASGIRNFAFAGLEYAGGGPIAHWSSMRCLHHVAGQWAAGKSDMVATVGSGLYPRDITRLMIHDFNNSFEVTQPFKSPTFAFDHTRASGNSFTGIAAASLAVSPGDVVNLFDGDTTTGATISNGDFITLEWTKKVILPRIEILWDKVGFGAGTGDDLFEIEISASEDGTTFEVVKFYNDVGGRVRFSPGNAMVKLYGEHDGVADTFTFTSRLDAIAAKFLKITFTGPQTGTRDVREIRIYGAGSTAGKFTNTFNDFSRTFSRPSEPFRGTQLFNTIREFESIPPGWRTSGDWDWFVRGSGNLTKQNNLPTAQPTQDGFIASGVFAGESNGNGDGFVLRTSEYLPFSSSGIIEVDISIGEDELDEDGGTGRTIKWDTRYNLVADGGISLNDPKDDFFQFFVVPEGSGEFFGEVSNFWAQGACLIGTCDWFTVKTNVAPGNYTLKWRYKRGNTPSANTWPGDEAVAYVDNVQGLDAPPQPSIGGFIVGQSFASGTINGFLSKTIYEHTAGFIRGFFNFPWFLGIIRGLPNVQDTRAGFLFANREAQRAGYTLGGIDLRSYPTGQTHGYLPTFSGAKQLVQGYLLGNKEGQIAGFMEGNEFTSTPSGVFGYMKVIDAFGTVFGGVNLGQTITFDSIQGFMNARSFEVVHGYLLNAGASGTIHGYLSPQKVGFINAYLLDPVTTATGSIASYMKVPDAAEQIAGYLMNSGVLSSIQGFLEGTINEQFIAGYLLNFGAAFQTAGYMNTIASESVAGFTEGAELVSGIINAYTSGVGFAPSQVAGYTFGVSGIINDSINGYMVGVGMPESIINGYIVGFDPSEEPCLSHGTVPLPPLPSFTIPTGSFIN